jgi:magnesium transporter
MSELLNDLEDHIDRENLKRLLHYARRLAGFQSRVKYVLGSIGEVLESGMSHSRFPRRGWDIFPDS